MEEQYFRETILTCATKGIVFVSFSLWLFILEHITWAESHHCAPLNGAGTLTANALSVGASARFFEKRCR
jgi:hypothetical protein